MKRYKIQYFFFILLLFSYTLTIRAQEKSFSDYLNNFYKTQKNVVEEKQSVNFEEAIKTIAERNIKEFLNNVNSFRNQGKSPEEVSSIMKINNISGTGSISGFVYESDGITPTTGYLSVRVFNEYGMYAGYCFVSSYDYGHYLIQNLPAGEYYVQTESDTYFDEYFDNATTWQEATLVDVLDGQETSQINFSLDHYEGVILGRVEDPDGNPLIDCSVSAREITFDNYNYASTDSLGNYSIVYLRPGTYKVFCSYYGSENFTDQWYQNAESYEDADSVILPTEDTVKNINFNLSTGGAITGNITKDDGSLFTAYEVYLNLYSVDDGYIIASPYLDSTGTFMLNKLKAGDYKLKAEYYGYENFVTTWFINSYSINEAEVIQVIKGDTVENINFSILPGGSISGNIAANGPYSPGNVVVLDEQMNYISGYNTYTSENYLIDRLAPGNYKVTANFTDYKIQWYDNKDDFESADWVTVNPNDTTDNIDFNLQQSPPQEWATITGNIINPQGIPCDGRVYVYDLNYNQITGAYVYSGQYWITSIPPGKYKIEAYSFDYGSEWYSNKDSYLKADTVTLSANEIKQINFMFDYLGCIAGYAIDEIGNRIDGEKQNVFAAVFDATTGEYLIDRSLTFVGGYKIKLRDGNYKLGLIPVYFNSQENYDSLSRTFYENGVSFNDPATSIINLFSPQDLELEDITIENATGSISGTIYDADNQPIDSVNYVLLAYDEDGFLAKASSYSIEYPGNGFFKIIGLHPGNYYLLAFATNGEQYMQIQWYDGIDVTQSIENISLKMNIPNNINAIEVGAGEAPGINLFFNTTTDINEEKVNIESFALYQNYPNPFNPNTTISFSIPNSAKVELKVFNLLGQDIVTLVNQEKPAGTYEITWNAANLPSGVYFYRLQAGSFVQTRKMILLK
jgi:hypothetical protein